MLLPKPLAIILLSIIPFNIATHPLEIRNDVSNSVYADNTSPPNKNALGRRQTDQKLWIGYQNMFIWSAAIISTVSPIAPPLDMAQFYADVKAQAKSGMIRYSAQNPGKQPQGTWEYYKVNLHFTAIALNDGIISFQLMDYALSRLGSLTARGWTQHFTAIFQNPGTNSSMLVNVEATSSPDGVVVDTLLHGYNPPQLTPSAGDRHPQIPNSHNDAGGKPDLSERIDHMNYLSQFVSSHGS